MEKVYCWVIIILYNQYNKFPETIHSGTYLKRHLCNNFGSSQLVSTDFKHIVVEIWLDNPF